MPDVATRLFFLSLAGASKTKVCLRSSDKVSFFFFFKKLSLHLTCEIRRASVKLYGWMDFGVRNTSRIPRIWSASDLFPENAFPSTRLCAIEIVKRLYIYEMERLCLAL